MPVNIIEERGPQRQVKTPGRVYRDPAPIAAANRALPLAQRYAPSTINQLIGSHVQWAPLARWLHQVKKAQEAVNPAGSARWRPFSRNNTGDGANRPCRPRTGRARAAMLLGPHGCGKTTLARVLLRNEGYNVVEFGPDTQWCLKEQEHVSARFDASPWHSSSPTVLAHEVARVARRTPLPGFKRAAILIDDFEGICALGGGGGGGASHSGWADTNDHVSQLIAALVDLPEKAAPVIICASDSGARAVRLLRDICLVVWINAPNAPTLASLASDVARKEARPLDQAKAMQMALAAQGDMRRMLNDLDIHLRGPVMSGRQEGGADRVVYTFDAASVLVLERPSLDQALAVYQGDPCLMQAMIHHNYPRVASPGSIGAAARFDNQCSAATRADAATQPASEAARNIKQLERIQSLAQAADMLSLADAIDYGFQFTGTSYSCAAGNNDDDDHHLETRAEIDALSDAPGQAATHAPAGGRVEASPLASCPARGTQRYVGGARNKTADEGGQGGQGGQAWATGGNPCSWALVSWGVMRCVGCVRHVRIEFPRSISHRSAQHREYVKRNLDLGMMCSDAIVGAKTDLLIEYDLVRRTFMQSLPACLLPNGGDRASNNNDGNDNPANNSSHHRRRRRNEAVDLVLVGSDPTIDPDIRRIAHMLTWRGVTSRSLQCLVSHWSSLSSRRQTVDVSPTSLTQSSGQSRPSCLTESARLHAPTAEPIATRSFDLLEEDRHDSDDGDDVDDKNEDTSVVVVDTKNVSFSHLAPFFFFFFFFFDQRSVLMNQTRAAFLFASPPHLRTRSNAIGTLGTFWTTILVLSLAVRSRSGAGF